MSRSGAFKLGLFTAGAVLMLLLATAGTVGMTWDEPIYSAAAENATTTMLRRPSATWRDSCTATWLPR